MADPTDRAGYNVRGRYYVDRNCVGCEVCLETAPSNFRTDETEGLSYVFKQPQNNHQMSQCREAMESCPAGSIGDDGDWPLQMLSEFPA